MFDFKVVKRVEIPTISEEVLKEILIKAISEKLPADVVVNDVDFVVTRKGGTAINLDVDAQFADATSEPLKATAPKAEPEVKAAEVETKPIELPEADDVIEPEEVTVTRDGVPSVEEEQLSLIDEVLAEEEEAPFETEETKPESTGKSLSELFS